MTAQPRIAIGPSSAPAPSVISEAVGAGGATVVSIDEGPEALVWLDSADVDGLGEALATAPSVRWIQLPFAGVEHVATTGMFADGRTWTSAKGTYGPACAEHALALALAGLRFLPERISARSWGDQAARTLLGAAVTILGGGGIASDLVRMLTPFETQITVVRRQDTPLPGAAVTVPVARLDEALGGATVVFVALALTPETRGIVAAPQFEAMDGQAWLINVARGAHVVTDDLVDALRSGTIAGAGLDVTDPEPLPDGHPLWDLDNCIITPHTANPLVSAIPLLAGRVRRNVAHLVAGEPFEGLVDPSAGY
ncbi:MAG: D-isomer specific 2-hydroxyacid dehydrogenase family protein [Actinomycetota bacterium]|nr:D-isomer specific 2-hydroxyacid dehydrogenase family protein [Actinomycetota bacterium]